MRVKMTSIHVKDPVAAHKFYTETLGFTELVFMPEASLAVVAAPGQDVGLLLEPSDPELGTPYREGLYAAGVPAIVMGTVDVQAEFDRLQGLGVRFSQDPAEGPTGMTAVFDDTCGNYVQLHQD